MSPVRILLWHGYLLGGTGSNVYTRQLAREWSLAGHDVTVLSQEPRPEAYDLGHAAVVRPDVHGFLPVFVLDRYEGYEVRRVQDCAREELDAWVYANAAAIRALLPADLVFANHVLLGGPVGAATGARYAVKAHGSELEYSMRGRPDLSQWGAETLAKAEVVYAGSEHIRAVLTILIAQRRNRHAYDDCGIDRTPRFGVDRRQRNSAKILLKTSVAVDAVNLPHALRCKLERFGDLLIDHRSISAGVEQKLAANFSAEFIALPAPRAGDQRANRAQSRGRCRNFNSIAPVGHLRSISVSA